MYCIRLDGGDNVILKTEENTMQCLEEKKTTIKVPKRTQLKISQSHLPNLRISAHDNFNFGGFYVYSLVHLPEKK